MKKVLITSKNSYIGKSVGNWLINHGDTAVIYDSFRNIDPSHYDFSNFDAVIHVAGIAHVDARNISDDEYYKVNRDLAILIAKKAKADKVKSFIFTSSSIIFGKDTITADPVDINIFEPQGPYGKSKLEADLAIQTLHSQDFKVSVLRLPAVYGPNSRGNFSKLIKIARSAILVPNIENRRSFLFIDNLSELCRLIIENETSGVYYPQNKDIMSTIEIIQLVRKILNKKTYRSILFGKLLQLLMVIFKPSRKMFGNKYYLSSVSNHFNGDYQIIGWEDSLKRMLLK